MAKVTLTQFCFNRGELAPALHWRSDWKYYHSGAETLKNLVTRIGGGATKRGGLRLVTRALNDDSPSRLIPFRFSILQSYMLELGDHVMRIIKDGGVVTYPDDHALAGGEVLVETPYPASSLSRLRHAQTADLMILTHPEFAPRRLARHDHHDWRFDRLVTNARTPAPEGLRVTRSGGDNARYVVTAHSSAEGESPPSETAVAINPDNLSAPDEAQDFSVLYAWLRSHDYAYMPATLAFDSWEAYPLIDWLIACGYVDRGKRSGVDGYRWHHVKPGRTAEEILYWWSGNFSQLVAECLQACDKGWAGAVKPALNEAIARYVEEYNASLTGTRITTLAWNPVEGAEGYRIYRNRSPEGQGEYARVGNTAATSFTDENLAAAGGLPEETELFTGVGDYPGVCAFFEQRLVLARTNHQPTTFWGSDTGIHNSFSRHSPILDTDSYEFTLASGEMNEIHWIVPLNDMLLGTSGGEWKLGGNGAAITPATINARVQSWYGCSALQPVVAGRTVIFAGRGGRTIRSFSYSLEAYGYTGQDLTAYAGHLFAGREIVDICYQQEPSGMLWVVLSDGGLLSCTYSPEEDVVSWSRHETDGRVEGCGSLVDVSGRDQIYFCVERRINGAVRRFIEILEEPADAPGDGASGFFVDCGLSYSGPPVGRVAGLDHLEGETVACLADGAVFAGLEVRDGAFTLPHGFTASVIHAGLPYEAELVTLDLQPGSDETLRNRSRFAVSAAVSFQRTAGCLFGHSGGALSTIKFRTAELPGRAAEPFTGEKYLVFSTPPGTRATRLRFLSDTPTPFTILGIAAEASCGAPA